MPSAVSFLKRHVSAVCVWFAMSALIMVPLCIDATGKQAVWSLPALIIMLCIAAIHPSRARFFSALCLWFFLINLIATLDYPCHSGDTAKWFCLALILLANPLAVSLPSRIRIPWALISIGLFPISLILFLTTSSYGYLPLPELAIALGLPADGGDGLNLYYANKVISCYHLPTMVLLAAYLLWRHKYEVRGTKFEVRHA